MPVDLERVEEIFVEAAMQADVPLRNAYLDEVCGEDADLRARVEALLTAHDNAGDFLKLPGAVATPFVSVIEEQLNRIGRYKLLEQIGEGGFAVVFMAEQERPVRRRVALKVIKLGMDTREVVARFEAERQALAMMDHPSIAKVFDAGATSNGRPYFVMELVKGVPITEYCNDQNLSIEQRLRLFAEVCEAVQHAHQKGIIHRDLKPTNVLVSTQDGRPLAKIIDFGIAKATHTPLTDRTLFTSFRQFMGTPAYMSPEQTGGSLDIDTRSDVYSLGVVLYELLAGYPPFDSKELCSKSFHEMQRIVREVQPPTPSARFSMQDSATQVATAHQRQGDPIQLRKLLSGDVGWIVMKALDKDREQRYESANAFAQDIERFLNDEMVLARPPSRMYRLRKLMRRNKLPVAAAAAVAAALLLGTGASSYMFLKERMARERAVAAEHRAQTAHASETRLRQHAEAQEMRARAEAAKSQQVAQFMKDMLHGVASDVAQGRDTTLLRGIVDRTAQRIGQLETQPDVEAELCIVVGQVYRDLAEFERAESMLRQAVNLTRRHFGGEHGQVATALNHLASVLFSRHNYEEAEARHREALGIRRKLYGENHPLVAESLDNLGLTLHRDWRNGEAEPLYRQALAIRRSVFGDEHEAVALSLSNLAVLLRVERRLEESEPLHREALAIRRKLLGNDHPDVAISVNGLGNLLRDQGKLKEAELLHREALAIRRKIYGDEHPYVAQSLRHLASGLFRQGRFAEAEELLDEGLAIQKETRPATHAADEEEELDRDKAARYLDWSLECEWQGQFDLAETAARRAIELQADNAMAHRYLGIALHGKHQFSEAIAAHREAVRLDANDPWNHYHLGKALEENGQLKEAIAAYRETLQLQPDHAHARRELDAALAGKLPSTADAGARATLEASTDDLKSRAGNN